MCVNNGPPLARIINRYNCCAISRNLKSIPFQLVVSIYARYFESRVYNSWSALTDGPADHPLRLPHLLSSTLPYPLFPLPAPSYPICSAVIISRLSRSPTETSSRIHKFLRRIRGILQQRIPEILSPKIFQKFVPPVPFPPLLLGDT